MQPPPPPGREPSAEVGVRSRQTPFTPEILVRLIEKSQVPPPVSGPLVSGVLPAGGAATAGTAQSAAMVAEMRAIRRNGMAGRLARRADRAHRFP